MVKKELIFTDVEQDYVSISTPFIDTNFDNINLYARIINQDQVEVSDFGYTITNLEELGITLNKRSKTVWRIYESALNDFGINREDEALIIRTSLDRFPIAKNKLLQGIMRINDISYLSKGNVKAAFNDIVEEYFINNGILYTPNVEIANGNGIASRFDFSIPSKSGIEHLVKTTARPNDPNYAKTFNFDVKATKPKRPRANFVYVLNDFTHQTEISQATINTALSGLEAGVATVTCFEELKHNNQFRKRKRIGDQKGS